MKSNYILLKLNKKNEIRADVGITIESLGLIGLEDINVKIDTGCPYTSIPVKKLGVSTIKAQEWKIRDSNDDTIDKKISFGVNDTEEKKQEYMQKFRNGEFDGLPAITFVHHGLTIDIDGVIVEKNDVKVSYDRAGNILIGMDIMKDWDIHMGNSKETGEYIFLACPYDQLNDEYYKELDKHFDLVGEILLAETITPDIIDDTSDTNE